MTNLPMVSAHIPGKPEGASQRNRVHGLTLLVYPDTRLRCVSGPVETFDSTLQEQARVMLSQLRRHGGLGLAASQIGLSRRIIVARIGQRELCLVNPQIKDHSDPHVRHEACLSLPGVHVPVARPERVRVTGYNLQGRKTGFGATGLWARVLQHTIDHLNGLLICDYAHPPKRECGHCPLALPDVLIEERKHYRSLFSRRSRNMANAVPS